MIAPVVQTQIGPAHHVSAVPSGYIDELSTDLVDFDLVPPMSGVVAAPSAV